MKSMRSSYLEVCRFKICIVSDDAKKNLRVSIFESMSKETKNYLGEFA